MYIYIYIIKNMWAEPAQITGPGINPKNNGPISAQNGWADIDPKYFLFFGPSQTQPIRLGQNWPGPIANELFAEREQ
jgi:hypothetical protein